MYNENKVVIINSKGEILPLGRLNSSDLHGQIISKYLKETYSNVRVYQSLDYDTYLPVLFYFCAMEENILLINTSEKSKRPSCTLILPNNYKDNLAKVKEVLSFFRTYEFIIEAYPYSDGGFPRFKVEIENINHEETLTTLENGLDLNNDDVKKLSM